MTLLSVNIDHIASIRQARQTTEPDPVEAAVICELAGAYGITSIFAGIAVTFRIAIFGSCGRR